MTKKTILLITILIVTLFITGCSIDENPDAVGELEEGVDYFIFENAGISIPLTSFKTLNPLYVDNLSYYHFSKLIFEGLFEYDNNLQPIPRLASTYTISEDGKTLEVSLRPDIYWHNGEKLVADDVVFTVNTITKTGPESFYGKLVSNGTNSGNLNIISARALSESKVEISFKESTGNILDLLTFPVIYRGNESAALGTEDYIPVGTGPYKFVEHVKYKEVHLKSNDNYRDGEPQISYIVGKIYSDRELIPIAFETGKLDISPIDGVDWDKFEHNDRISIIEYVSGDYEFLVFNHKAGILSTESAKDLKTAIMYGVDRQSIIEKVYLQHATQVDTPIHPSSYLATESVNGFGYSKEKAEEILKAAGFMDGDGDGIVESIDGEPIVLKMLVNPVSNIKLKIAEMIRSNLKEIGISIEFQYPTGTNHQERKNSMINILLNGDYDVALLGWEQAIIPGLSFSLGIESEQNYSTYYNENMKEILIEMSTQWDESSKRESYQEFQNFFLSNLPYGSLFYRNKALLVDSQISGPLEPTYYNLYKGLEKCYLTMYTN